MDIFCIKHGDALHPASAYDKEELDKLPQDQAMRMTLRRVRNIKFHRKYMAMVHLAYDNWPYLGEFEGYKDFDSFRKELQILAGYRYPVVKLNGDVYYQSKSIAFGNMGEDEFAKLYEAVLEAVRRHVIHHMDDEDLQNFLNELEQFA